MYKSTISFTLDVVCPWTYVAKKRLEKALAIVRADPDAASAVTFTVLIRPYQLDPTFPTTPVPKRAHYEQKFGAGRFALMEPRMAAVGAAEGITFSYGGTIQNTLPAHRVLQRVQKDKGPEKAWDVLGGLYTRYFEKEQNPSSRETLEAACREAGLEEGFMKGLIDGGDDEGLAEVQEEISRLRSNGVDAVPHIVLEGKRRDITLVGAREVEEYVKTLQTIIKESK